MSRLIVKKKLFQVTDTGDFVDSVYNESIANSLYSNLIGRSQIVPNLTSQFSASDVSHEGKLYKKGTYYQNWKERYFILRRDLHKLCYYDERDTLVLLGSIELKPTSFICRINPEDADNYNNAFCIAERSDSLSASINVIIIMSAHSTLEFQQWVECLTSEIAEVREATNRPWTGRAATWWNHLFDKASELTPTPDVVQLELKRIKEQEMPIVNSDFRNNSSNLIEPTRIASSTLSTPLEEEEETGSDLDRDAELSLGQRADRMPSDVPAYITPEMEQRRSIRLSTITFREPKLEKVDKRLGPPPMDASLAPKFLASPSEMPFVQCLQINLRARFMCGSGDQLFVSLARLAPSAPLISHTDKDGDKSPIHSFRPTPVNTRIRSLRTTATSAIAAAEAAPPGCEWCPMGRTEVYLVSEQAASGRRLLEENLVSFSVPFPVLSSTSEIYQISLCRSKDAGGGINEITDGGNDTMTSNASNSSTICLARGIFLRRDIESNPIAVIRLDNVRSLTESVSEESRNLASADVGIVRLRSHSLLQFREKLEETMKFPPYAEALFAPSTVGGRCLSVEQIFVSHHPVGVGSALCALFLRERRPYVHTLLTLIEGEEAEEIGNLNSETLQSQGSSLPAAVRRMSGVDVDEKVMMTMIKIEAFGKALNALDSICKQQLETLRLARNHCRALDAGEVGVTNGPATKRLNKIVIPESVGGLYLRRSVWKEPDRWQFCTMNLNIHLLTAQRLSSQELQLSASPNASAFLQSMAHDPFVLPTITLGVPAAHRLDFTDGGLRTIFGRLPSDSSRLLWMAAIQGPHSYESLARLFERCPRERAVLFPQIPSLEAQHKEELVCVTLKRRYELAERLDMCGSQALGLAITVVHTVIRLAASGVREQYDVLCRSLRVGFLISCEGFLSSWDAELGMIEDADMAMLWLSLLTLRLVIRGEGVSEQHCERQQPELSPSRPTGPLSGPPPPCETQQREDGVKRLVNAQHGDVSVRRDAESGRLIVDLEVNRSEADVIRAAQEEMGKLQYDASTSTAQSPFPFLHTASSVMTHLTEALSPVGLRNYAQGSGAPNDRNFENIFVAPTRFNSNPTVQYDGTDEIPEVLAVVELTGVLFNQGVNAWQTIANWIRDVSRQADVNRSSLARLREYYNRHRTALMHQLQCRESTFASNPPLTQGGNSGSLPPTSSPNIPPSLYSVLFMSRQSPSQSTHGVGAPLSTTTSSATGKEINRNSFNMSRNSFRLGGGTYTRSAISGLSMCELAIVEADKLMHEAQVAVELACNRPSDIHVHVLLKTSAICRHLAGTIAVFCKSGKDRTAMGVTLDMTRCLVEAEGVLAGKAICNVLRAHGCRRMNVYANTGQPMYAFGTLDRSALPNCYVPAANICNSNVHG